MATKKAVYGLTNASRVWYLQVVDELNKLNAKVSSYDKALFSGIKMENHTEHWLFMLMISYGLDPMSSSVT